MNEKLAAMEYAYVGRFGTEGYRVEGCYATFVPGVFANLGVTTLPSDAELMESLALAGVEEGDGAEAVVIVEFSTDRKSVAFRTVSSFPFAGVWNLDIATREDVGSPDEYSIINGQVVRD